MKRSETVPFIPSPLLNFRRWIAFMTSPTQTEWSGRVSECSRLLISSSVFSNSRSSDLADVKIWRYLLAKTSAISLSLTYPSTEFAVFLLTLLIFFNSVHKSRLWLEFMDSAILRRLWSATLLFKDFTARWYFARAWRMTDASAPAGGRPQLTHTECQNNESVRSPLTQEFHPGFPLTPAFTLGKQCSPATKQISIKLLQISFIASWCTRSVQPISVQCNMHGGTSISSNILSSSLLYDAMWSSVTLCQAIFLSWLCLSVNKIVSKVQSNRNEMRLWSLGFKGFSITQHNLVRWKIMGDMTKWSMHDLWFNSWLSYVEPGLDNGWSQQSSRTLFNRKSWNISDCALRRDGSVFQSPHIKKLGFIKHIQHIFQLTDNIHIIISAVRHTEGVTWHIYGNKYDIISLIITLNPQSTHPFVRNINFNCLTNCLSIKYCSTTVWSSCYI